MRRWSQSRRITAKVYLLFIVILLTQARVTAAPFQAFDSKAQLSDRSAADSPLRAAGTASFHIDISADSKSIKCSLQGSLTNVSSKTVVAFEAALDISSDRGGCYHYDYRIDYIFNENMLTPGAKYDLSRDWNPVEWNYDGKMRVGEAEANFKVTFVEFSDGSSFGKSHWSNDLLNERKSEIQLMSSLLKAFDEGGTPALVKTIDDRLAQHTDPQSVWTLLFATKNQIEEKGANAAIEELHKRLATVEERSNLLVPI